MVSSRVYRWSEYRLDKNLALALETLTSKRFFGVCVQEAGSEPITNDPRALEGKHFIIEMKREAMNK